MRYEIERAFRFPSLWLVIIVSMGVRCVVAIYDRLYRFGSFWDLAASYFDIIGSLTLILLILLAPIRLFTDDKQHSMEEFILTARKGRLVLMVRRYTVCFLFGLLMAVLLSVCNYIISAIIGGSPAINLTVYWHITSQVAIGGAGLAVVAGALCGILRSHPATLIICGLFTLSGFMIRGSMVKPFDFLWFFECGFFNPLLRGHACVSWEGWFHFWSLWHIVLISLFLLIDIYKRKERKTL
ncbi:MAG: ABC-2 family transporter protein [Firmicutes bacterium ADurb.Bin419]|nr:MAG: ABC-2 family transporter protein [Firmicutes bacterium ADurb.Bin419]